MDSGQLELSSTFKVAGMTISQEELMVIVVVVLILGIFELGPKLFNFIKKRRSKS